MRRPYLYLWLIMFFFLVFPVGVPKVAYRLPGEEEATWADLYNVMYRERNVFLMQEIQDEIANQVTGIMLFIHIENAGKKKTKPIHFFINSTGGSIYSGLAIHGIMNSIDPPVHTLCMGLAASMASVITLGGEPNHRLIAPTSRIMIHQPATAYFDGKAGECFREAKEMLRMRSIVTDIYRQQNGKSRQEISLHLERDLMLSPQEAINYGIADRIAIELPELNIDYYNLDAYEFDDLPTTTEDGNGAIPRENPKIEEKKPSPIKNKLNKCLTAMY